MLALRPCRMLWLLYAWLVCCQHAAQSQDNPLDKRVKSAARKEYYEDIVKRATDAIAVDRNDHAAYRSRCMALIALGNSRAAIADVDYLLAVNAKQPSLLELRGTEKFKLGEFKEAIADFDRECELDARREPWHWKRGLAYYYAGQFARGRDQFQSYHDRDDHDVENAVWRVMCMARMKGVGLAKAQKDILVVQRDSRVPMMEVYALFAGKAEANDVLQAVEAGNPGLEERNGRIFYGNLYLGLYCDLTARPDAAIEHLKVAVDHPIEHFMWDIAKLHLGILRQQKAASEKAAD